MELRLDSKLLAVPGGWLEKYETFEIGAARETEEETGLKISLEHIKLYRVFNCIY